MRCASAGVTPTRTVNRHVAPPRYGEPEWREIRAEWDAIVAELAAAKAAGEPADGERAMAAAERHRQHISRWFYDCPPAMHRGLGRMSSEDPRFARNYDNVAPGLADYVRDAFAANADARGAPRNRRDDLD